jgi:hypothetical protein
MRKWEYLTVERDGDISKSRTTRAKYINGVPVETKDLKPFHQYLQEIGGEGWELVSTEGVYYYFKRPIE